MILMIDNYDSFTYNLVQYLEEIGAEVLVERNDRTDLTRISAFKPQAIVISPGPGGPKAAGISLPVIQHFSGRLPILGVCLGHQCIGAAFGAQIVGARHLMHGKTSRVTSDGQGVFTGFTQPFQAMRYHSLAIAREALPDCLKITAESDDGEIMGIRHKSHRTEGIQFHPESIMTTAGKRLLRNFVNMTAP
jgi:anthranilate synthase/aminodeoxychorismate synthase-like glutamine amidotransferase